MKLAVRTLPCFKILLFSKDRELQSDAKSRPFLASSDLDSPKTV